MSFFPSRFAGGLEGVGGGAIGRWIGRRWGLACLNGWLGPWIVPGFLLRSFGCNGDVPRWATFAKQLQSFGANAKEITQKKKKTKKTASQEITKPKGL